MLAISLIAGAVVLVAVFVFTRALAGDWVSASRWKQSSAAATNNIPVETRRHVGQIHLSSTPSVWAMMLALLDEMGAEATGAETFESEVPPPPSWRFWRRGLLPNTIDRSYLEARVAELERLTGLESNE